MWPADDTLLDAWTALVADSDTAAAFAELVLAPLTQALAGRFPFADDGDISTAAGDAVLAVLKRPERYDPTRLPLHRYLLVIARRKLMTVWTAGKKHRGGRIPWDSVELDLPARNDPVDDDAPSFDTPELQAVIAGFSTEERAVFDLLLTDERRTEMYAVALGLTGDAAAEVKRAKDRIKARLKRAAGGDHD